MAWGRTVEEQKREFLAEFGRAGANRREVCRHHQVSPKAGYALWRRYLEEGEAALRPRSHRPKHSPDRLPAELESRLLELRAKYGWGARKLRRLLRNQGCSRVPAKSTVEAVLRRNGLIDEERSRKSQAFKRFEHENPNDLWQADFKGHFPLRNGERCHPLVIVDDHSRYLVRLQACRDERRMTVQAVLVDAFQELGLPRWMLMDNGSPWGSAGEDACTELEVWLMRLGVGVSHGRPHHPQTQGKVERLNRTMGEEVILDFLDHPDAQRSFDVFRPRYNEIRPHESLGLETPASRYRPSARAYPEKLPPIEYDAGDEVRRVQDEGVISYRGRKWRVGKAFRGQPVALRQEGDEKVAVYFCSQRIRELDLRGGGTRGGSRG